MKATKDHISLETAKLLKDCGVESKEYYLCIGFYETDNTIEYYIEDWIIDDESGDHPAFTWQEILWEYNEIFFNNEYLQKSTTLITQTILTLLQQKKYEEADLYFREHCILIK